MKRRVFLKSTLAGSAVAVAVGAGLVTPRSVLAAWPKTAFEAKDINSSLTDLYGSGATEPSSEITIKAPDIAENGAVVPVTISTGLSGIESIVIYAEKNATPMIANFHLASSAKGYISTRIKMGKTSDVVAVVKAGGKVYSARKNVKVTIGGCGG
jgi:sulfur-oxidizing protein SoxY